jgi:hypothetical protein
LDCRIATRLLTDAHGLKLLFGVRNDYPDCTLERHAFESRGTGGVLADVARDYADDDVILVMEGSQLLEEPLATLVDSLWDAEAQVSLFAQADESPLVMMLFRCGCLRRAARLGAIDLKSELLPRIAEEHRVNITRRAVASGTLLESPAVYIESLQRYHRRKQREAGLEASLPALWQPVFSIVEAGGRSPSGAHIHDSVVLRGGQVQAGATLVRCVVGWGGVVREGETYIDAFIGKKDRR